MSLDDIKERGDTAAQIDIELQREIDDHAEHLILKMPLHKLESAIVDSIQKWLDNRDVISNLFDNDVNFQEWIAGVRDEMCRRISDADVQETYKRID